MKSQYTQFLPKRLQSQSSPLSLKKSVATAGVDYSWMHKQQAPAPRPAQAQQPASVSQLLNSTYRK